MRHNPVAVAKAMYEAYTAHDRTKAEALVAQDFHFTSTFDNRIDRATYFDRCWPNNESIADFNLLHIVGDDERALVVYEAQSTGGKRFRNTEILTAREGKLVDVEVYFGWAIPHAASDGGFLGG